MSALPCRVRFVTCLLLVSGLGLSCEESVPSTPASVVQPDFHPTSPPAEHALNLVLVVLDTTRPDFLSPYGAPATATPFLETFAAQATRFDRAYSSSSWTLPAHATMFTGTLPATHGATQSTLRVAKSLPLLAETLRDSGYATAGFSANPWIGNDAGLQRGFEKFERIDSVKKGWLSGQVTDDKAGRPSTIRPVMTWLRGRPDPAQPFFLFVNLTRAHHPYIPSPEAARELLGLDPNELREVLEEFYPELPDGRARSLMNRHYERKRPLSAAEWDRLSGLYRASLRTADEDLRRILEAVDRRSDARETLVLVVSDHGESLGEHGHFGHILNLYETSVRVAFLARGPGFEPGATDATPVHLADVHATLLGGAQLAQETGAIGVDLARRRPRQRILSASLESPSLQLNPFSEEVLESGVLDGYRSAVCAAIGWRYKLIARSDGTEELYDLAEDPAETSPLDPLAIDEDVVSALRASIERTRQGQADPSRADIEMDEATLESLRALGYVK